MSSLSDDESSIGVVVVAFSSSAVCCCGGSLFLLLFAIFVSGWVVCACVVSQIRIQAFCCGCVNFFGAASDFFHDRVNIEAHGNS